MVDDDDRVLEALRRALTLKGFATTVAVDGEMALSQLAVSAPDVIVLDVKMPGIDGIEVCRRVRQPVTAPRS